MIEIIGKEQLEEFLWSNKDKVSVIYFGAEWCGPCKNLKEKLASNEALLEMPNLIVGHINIDINPDNNPELDESEKLNAELSEIYKVSSIPLQVFVELKGTKINIIDQIIGYDWIKFKMIYNKIMESKQVINE